jgi:hypothetical protein
MDGWQASSPRIAMEIPAIEWRTRKRNSCAVKLFCQYIILRLGQALKAPNWCMHARYQRFSTITWATRGLTNDFQGATGPQLGVVAKHCSADSLGLERWWASLLSLGYIQKAEQTLRWTELVRLFAAQDEPTLSYR